MYTEDKDDVTYGFLYQGQFVHETQEFEINPFSGTITAKQTFDREEKDSYIVSQELGVYKLR